MKRLLSTSIFPIIAVVSMSIAPASARADWIQDGLPVSLTNGYGYPGAVVPDGAGGVFVVWQDNRGADYDVYAQRIDELGVLQWIGDGVLVCGAVDDQDGAIAISDGLGGAIIAWVDQRSGSSRDIYAQRIDGAGVPQWTANGVALCTAANEQLSLFAITDGFGGAILAWQDARSGTNWDAYARRIDFAGVPQWTADGVAVCTLPSSQTRIHPVTDGANGVIVSWDDFRSGTTDVYAQRLNASGVPQWTANGLPVCTAANNQNGSSPVSDGLGGAIIAWADFRSDASGDIWAQRINSAGTPLWYVDGVPVSQEVDVQSNQSITTDGAGGAIIAWQDGRAGAGEVDLYAQRINSYGAVIWTSGGAPVCQALGVQEPVALIPDGAEGVFAVWPDDRAGLSETDIHAQHIDAGGVARWQYDGVPVSTAAGSQNGPLVTLDGSGGVIVAWGDGRTGIASHPYAQRAEPRYGYWGRPEPTIVSAEDNPNDQGGKVIVRWTASQRDRVDNPGISQYTLWRSTDNLAPRVASSQSPPRTIRDPAELPKDFHGEAILETITADGPEYWEWIANLAALYQPTYSYTASTRQDSTIADPATHYFKVVAMEYTFPLSHAWESDVVSTYSVDNLAPPAPIQLTANRTTGGAVMLSWKSDSTIPDLAHYALYRSGPTEVMPTAPFFLDTSDLPAFNDLGAPGGTLHYVVTALDVHGNQSLPSNVAAVFDATDVGGNPSPSISHLTVLQNRPNPTTGPTELEIGLPAASDIEVEVYDVSGRRVGSIEVHSAAAGWQHVAFAGRDDAGRPLPSGVYFYRVHANGTTVTHKLVIAR